MQQNGDFDLCDAFKILDVFWKITKYPQKKQKTKMADDSIFFILLIYEHTSSKSLRNEIY